MVNKKSNKGSEIDINNSQLVFYYSNCRCNWVLRRFREETQFQLLKKPFINVITCHIVLLLKRIVVHI